MACAMTCVPTPLPQLGQESAMAVIDATSFPQRGQKSAGVFLASVTAKGHALIDRERYLPADWCEDRDRRRAAGIPESGRFQTKPELARRMLARLWNAQIPIAWVVADTVSGNNLDLRTWLEDRGYAYVLAVARPRTSRDRDS
jgi:SRSO17 transposase